MSQQSVCITRLRGLAGSQNVDVIQMEALFNWTFPDFCERVDNFYFICGLLQSMVKRGNQIRLGS